MIRRLNCYHFYLRLTAYLLAPLAFGLAACLRLLSGQLNQGPQLDFHSYFNLLLFTALAWAVAVEHYGVSSVDELFRERTGIRAAFAACGATYAVVLGLIFFFYHGVSFSRTLLGVSAILLLWLTLAMRAVFRAFVRRRVELKTPDRILVIGADRFAVRAAQKLIRGPLSFCRIVGYVPLPQQEVVATEAPIYSTEQLEQLSREHQIDEIVLAIPPTRLYEIPRIMKIAERLCVPVRAIIDLGDRIFIRERMFQFGRLQMLDLTSTPAESVKYLLAKRVFDVVFSSVVLLLAAPLMAAIAIAVRLSSPGPILFSQDRVGLNGKVFRMYKFRTMTAGPENQWSMANDPRRTKLGVLLRKTSLDELPQFINVLRGDMSVVGPRPERPYFVQKFLNEVAKYNNRHRLKVGITGWAQVNGWRGDTSIPRRVEHDLYYLQNWSFTFDLRIIFLTLFGGFTNKNAY